MRKETSEETKMATIYALYDPRSIGVIRYIGKTSQPLLKRLREHMSKARSKTGKTYRCNWIRKLLSDGVEPCAKVIKVVPEADWQHHEREQIATHLSEGHPLTNCTSGGEGGEITQEGRDRIAAAHKGKVISDEQKRRVSEANTGRVFSEEHKRRLSESKAGKPASEEAKRKISESLKGNTRTLGYKHSEETRRKMSAAQRGKVISESQRKALLDANIGRKMSPEAIAKSVASHKRNREAKKAVALQQAAEEALICASLEEGFSAWL